MNRRELRILVGGGAANCVANGTWWLQPILMHQFISQHGMSDSAAGLILTVEIAALALASALATRWLSDRVPLRRLVIVATVLAAVASGLTLLVQHSYLGLMLVRAVAGLGCGIGLMAGNRLGAQAADPDSMFAKFGFVNILFGVTLLWALPPMTALAGESATFVLLLVSLIALLPLLLIVPADAPPAAGLPADEVARDRASGRIALIAAATFVVSLCSGIVWAYYAVIGEQTGMSEAEVDAAISMAIFASGAATVLAALIGGRFGRALPIGTGLVVMAGAILVLSSRPGPLAFRIATCFNMAMVYFLFPFFLGAGSAEDSAHGAAYVGSAFFLAGAASPFIGGLLVESAGIGIVGTGVAVAAVVVAALFAWLERRTPLLAPAVSR
jgi:predicted MFS family arabinose efflux permease